MAKRLAWSGNQRAQAEADAAYRKLKAKNKKRKKPRPEKQQPGVPRAARAAGLDFAAWAAGVDPKEKRRKQYGPPKCHVCYALEPLAPIVRGERRVCLYCVDKIGR